MDQNKNTQNQGGDPQNPQPNQANGQNQKHTRQHGKKVIQPLSNDEELKQELGGPKNPIAEQGGGQRQDQPPSMKPQSSANQPATAGNTGDNPLDSGAQSHHPPTAQQNQNPQPSNGVSPEDLKALRQSSQKTSKPAHSGQKLHQTREPSAQKQQPDSHSNSDAGPAQTNISSHPKNTKSQPNQSSALVNNQPEPANPEGHSFLQPVVRVYSTKGFEYWLQFVALWLLVVGLIIIGHDVVNYFFDLTENTLFNSFLWLDAAVVVSGFVFSFFYVRSKRLEARDPKLGKDVSRKRAIQWTLRLSFVGILLTLTEYGARLLQGSFESNLGIIPEVAPLLAASIKTALSLAVLGLIFVYYWFDEHREQGEGL